MAKRLILPLLSAVFILWTTSCPPFCMAQVDFVGAAKRAGLADIEDLLKNGHDINHKYSRGWTLLMMAASQGRLNMVQLLLDRGADVNLRANDGVTALMVAVERGYLETAQLLLDKGADTHAKDVSGRTALMAASSRGHLEVVRLPLDKGGCIEAIGPGGSNALRYAVTSGNLEVVKLLLSHGAKVNVDNQGEKARGIVAGLPRRGGGGTPLMWAAIRGHLEIVKLLLDKGAQVNATDSAGATALMEAVYSGRLEVIQLLLEHGADVNARDSNGHTALRRAVTPKRNEAAVRLLESAGAKIDLETACIMGKTELVRKLIAQGADVNLKNSDGKTSLHQAIESVHEELVKILIEAGADINANTGKGPTPMDIAKNRGGKKLQDILRAHGARTSEAFRIATCGNKVLRRGNELFFRLANGRIVSRKNSLVEGADFYTDPCGQRNVSYHFKDLIAPWYAIGEGYMEGAGLQLLNENSGHARTIHGYGVFSPDRSRFLAIGYPGESPCDTEIWKIADSEPVREYVLEESCMHSFRWSDSSTVEMIEPSGGNLRVVTDRISFDAKKGKWSRSAEGNAKPHFKRLRMEDDCHISQPGIPHREPRNSGYPEGPALIKAACKGDLNSVRSLAEQGAVVHDGGRFGAMALIYASQRGHMEIVKLLLEKGAGVVEYDKAEALRAAALQGHKEIVDILVSSGAELTLSSAAAIGDVQAMLRLIRGGADVNADDRTGRPPFSAALARKEWDAAETLLENGAQIEDEYGLFPIILTAAARDGHSKMIRALLDRYPVKPERLVYPMGIAAGEGRLESVKLFLAYGADVNLADEHGRTPLMAAAIMGHHDTVRELLARGADVNARDEEGATAVMDAAWRGDPEMLEFLVSKGARINGQDVYGRNAVAMAPNAEIRKLVEDFRNRE